MNTIENNNAGTITAGDHDAKRLANAHRTNGEQRYESMHGIGGGSRKCLESVSPVVARVDYYAENAEKDEKPHYLIKNGLFGGVKMGRGMQIPWAVAPRPYRPFLKQMEEIGAGG